jgi:hypothetical protein
LFEAGAFDSMSEYLRDLIRHRRQAQIEADAAFLEKAIQGAPLGNRNCGKGKTGKTCKRGGT